MTVPRLVLADHRHVLRVGTELALLGAGVDVVAAVGATETCLLQVERLSPDVVLVALGLPGATGSLLPVLRRQDPRPRLLVVDDLAGPAERDRLLDAIEAGADGYVTGRAGTHALTDAVLRLHAGESVVPPDMLGPLLRGLVERRRASSAAVERLMELTPREREILVLIANGKDQDDIARTLVISPETARTHIQRVVRKLGVRSRVEVVTLAAEHGLVERLERVMERADA